MWVVLSYMEMMTCGAPAPSERHQSAVSVGWRWAMTPFTAFWISVSVMAWAGAEKRSKSAIASAGILVMESLYIRVVVDENARLRAEEISIALTRARAEALGGPPHHVVELALDGRRTIDAACAVIARAGLSAGLAGDRMHAAVGETRVDGQVIAASE